MDDQTIDLREKVRQQFEKGPYPRQPIDKTPKQDYNSLFIHNLVTSYYLRNQQVVETEGKVILDAGCGTGYKALALAEANPGAKIVGIDFSEESTKLARQRLQYHGFENVEFYTLAIEDLPSLGMEFDYINNDEVLYLLPDPISGLQSMKSVLKPKGIIRTNLHSSLQRERYFRAQAVFKLIGLMQDTPGEYEIKIVRQTINALKDEVNIKPLSWKALFETSEGDVLANYLLQNDKGYTIPELFSALKAADLEFVSMVNWRHWDLMDLFKEPDNLPVFLAMSLPEISLEEQLHLFELLEPRHRLLDVWCAYPNTAQSFIPIAQWTLSDWLDAKVHLHPQLRTLQVKEDLLESIVHHRPFQMDRYITATSTAGPIFVDSSIAACLLPLWEGGQLFIDLVHYWLQIQPVDPATLEPMHEERALQAVKEFLQTLEGFLYVLLERLT